MFGKYIKNLTLYNMVIKLKPFWVSHLSVLCLLLCEIFAIVYAFLLHNENPTADYIIEYPLAFALSHLCLFTILGFLEFLLFGSQILIKLFLKKCFITNNEFLLNNKIYHVLWVLVNYIAVILSISTFIYILNLIKDGLL